MALWAYPHYPEGSLHKIPGYLKELTGYNEVHEIIYPATNSYNPYKCSQNQTFMKIQIPQ